MKVFDENTNVDYTFFSKIRGILLGNSLAVSVGKDGSKKRFRRFFVGGFIVRSKVFWLVVLALVVLIAVISCHAPRGIGSAGLDIITPSAPIIVIPDDEYPPYEYDEPEIEQPLPPEPGELDITTETKFIAGRYAGFLTWGYFRHSTGDLAVIESLVRDTYTGAELTLADIIEMEEIEKVLSLLAEAVLAHATDSAPYLDLIDEDWLAHLVIDHDGLGVLLPPDIAPWELGFMYVVLPYEELDETFKLGIEIGIRIPPHRPMVALTFDDGPSPYTEKILDILEAHGGRATFCVLGYRIQRQPETLIRAIALGSEVVGHSWDHADFTRLGSNAITNQITRTSTAIEEVIGQSPPPIMRAPFGQINNTVINTTRDLGYSLLHWSVDPRDWEYRDPDSIYYNIMRRVTEGSIILLHDIHPSTAEAMLRVIPRLIADGFQLVTASELIAYHYGELEPGVQYVGFRNASW